MKDRLLRWMTELTSRKFVSKMTGAFAKSRISRPLIRRFAQIYRIEMEEVEKRLEEYASLNEFFPRRLKPGSRPVDPSPDALVSPVDAKITACGFVRDGQLLHIKGQDYTLHELLGGSPRIPQFLQGFFWVLYLSPRDYHRIHAPCAGEIVETEHLSGRVYPVNDTGLRLIRRVLSRNERLVTYIRHDKGEVALVKVGALNVSSIRYVEPRPDVLNRGDELAYFEFGSTVVLLTEDGTFEPRPDLYPGLSVKMGEKLGTLIQKKK